MTHPKLPVVIQAAVNWNQKEIRMDARKVCFKDEHVKLKFIDLQGHQNQRFNGDPIHYRLLPSTNQFTIHKV